MIRIAIYQNDAFARVLTEVLSASDHVRVVGSFNSFPSLQKEVFGKQPDVIVMDMCASVNESIGQFMWMKKHQPCVKVLVITDKIDSESVILSVRAGVDGYLTRKQSLYRLHEFIKDVYDGGIPLSPFVIKDLLESQFKVNDPIQENLLTDREREVLQRLVDGMTYKLIGASLNISIDTVRSHIRNLYEKLNVRSKSEAVAKALRGHIVASC